MSVLRVLRHLPSRASPLLAASLMHSDSGTGVSGGASSLHRHSRYWAPEGTVILHCQPGNALYKLDGAALARRSPTYPWAVSGASQAGEEDGIPLFRLPSTLGVAPAELEALLDVFESTDPQAALAADTPFARLSSLLRVSDADHLNVPDVHDRARSLLEHRFTFGPHGSLLRFSEEEIESALALSLRYDIPSIQKGLFYTFITTSHFEEETHTADSSAPSPSHPARRPSLLSPAELQRCSAFQSKLLENFAPTLFQAPPGSHMECSNALADAWLRLVIPSAIASAPAEEGPTTDSLAMGSVNGAGTTPLELDLGRPLESLHSLESFDWTAHGVCVGCTEDRRAEWRAEREAIWEAMDGWS